MPRIRTIKPEFWSNDKLSALPVETHMFAAALLNHCDDEGFFNANPQLIGVQMFPVRDEYRTSTVHLQELSNQGFLELLNGVDGRVYGRVINFIEHQVINKPKPSKIREKIIVPYEYGIDTVSVPVGKERNRERKGKEEYPSGISAHTRKKNKIEDFTINNLNASDLEWFRENTPGVNVEATIELLLDYCRSTGKAYKDYAAALRVWCRKEQEKINRNKGVQRENIRGNFAGHNRAEPKPSALDAKAHYERRIAHGQAMG